MDHLRIKYLPPQIGQRSVVWKGEMQCPGKQREEICFAFTCPNPEAFTPFSRPFLLTFLVPAMRMGLPLQLEQPIDATTLDNLMEWQEGISRWHPGRLHVVPIRGDIAPSPFLSDESRSAGLTAFSGGVDSCFTAYRNTQVSQEHLFRHTPLTAGLMIHGFDIPESRPDTFRSAFERSGRILDALGLAGYELQTNVRRLEGVFNCEWEYETHGIWLAAALACFEPHFQRTLIPSSYPYHHQILPWGSTTLLDPLFASDANPLRHDGAAHTKLDKLRVIAHHRAIQENLRVCWEGTEGDRNCGQCSKCVMTQLCFWASGVRNPPCFDVPCSNASIETLKQDSYYQHLTHQIRKEARRQGMTQLDGQLGKAVGQTEKKSLWQRVRHPGLIFKAYD